MKIRTIYPAIFMCVSILVTTCISLTAAQTAAAPEKEKVGQLKDVKIIRNGWSYEPATAARFLRGKWAANDAEIKTARDFIDKVASISGTSGKPYLIRFKDGRKLPSREFLLAELRTIEP